MDSRSRSIAAGSGARRCLAGMLTAVLLAPFLLPATRQETFLLPAGAALPAGAQVLERVAVADALVVRAPQVPAGAVRLDEPVGFSALTPLPAGDGTRVDSGVASTRAALVWPQTRGERAVVALVDTGLAPVPALEGAVAGEIDFSGTGGGDGYGHGTYLASLIAGRGPDVPGVAPGTGVLSLKVAGPDGGSDLGKVLSALQWLYGPGRAAGIRVATLALGVEPGTPAAALLDLAVERLADNGVLVVTAAGNDGPGALSSPATSAGAFAVGATDDRGTPERDDDVPAEFSATGTDRAGAAKPDVAAAGVGVVGWMHPDAAIALAHPEALVGGGLIRGSGTSMSTALVAGVAALAQSARPDLDRAGLRHALLAAGGELDAPATVTAAEALPHRHAPPGLAGRPPAHASGPPAHASGKGPGGAQVLPSSVRWRSVRWRDAHWGEQEWGEGRWGSVRWRSVRWRSVRWRGWWGEADWDVAAWGSVRWRDDGGWAGFAYDGEDGHSRTLLESTGVVWAWRSG